jgi:hypothetical protein
MWLLVGSYVNTGLEYPISRLRKKQIDYLEVKLGIGTAIQVRTELESILDAITFSSRKNGRGKKLFEAVTCLRDCNGMQAPCPDTGNDVDIPIQVLWKFGLGHIG